MRLRTQLALAVTAVLVLAVTLAGLTIVLRLDGRDRADLDRGLADRATAVSATASKTGALPAGDTYAIRLITDVRIRAKSGPTTTFPMPVGTGYSTVSVGGQDWRSLVRELPSGARLQVLVSMADLERRGSGNATIVSLIALLAALVGGAGAWLLSARLLRPLERLTAGARDLRPDDDADERLPAMTGPPEVAELAATLNVLMDQLQADAAATRRFSGDAGDELRAPLTSLGVDLETLLDHPDLPATQRHLILAGMADEHQRIVALLDKLEAIAHEKE